VIAISVDASGETAGVGTRVALPEYTGNFAGLIGDSASVDALSGATYSSRGVKDAVNCALAAFEKVEKGN